MGSVDKQTDQELVEIRDQPRTGDLPCASGSGTHVNSRDRGLNGSLEGFSMALESLPSDSEAHLEGRRIGGSQGLQLGGG